MFTLDIVFKCVKTICGESIQFYTFVYSVFSTTLKGVIPNCSSLLNEKLCEKNMSLHLLNVDAIQGLDLLGSGGGLGFIITISLHR